MGFSKIVLIVCGVGFLGFGLAFVAAPAPMAGLTNITLAESTARTDVRAIYGGLDIGVGAFLLYCAVQPGLSATGLFAAILAYGSIALARTFGMVAEGEVSSTIWIAWLLEVGTTALAAVGYSRASPTAG